MWGLLDYPAGKPRRAAFNKRKVLLWNIKE